MLVRREETQPCRAVEALESMMPKRDFQFNPTNRSISILTGANHHHLNSVNTRSPPATPRLNFPRPVIAKTPKLPSCKPATGTNDEQNDRSNHRPIPSTSNHHYTPHNHPKCLDSSARSSPFPSVSSPKRAREREQKRRQGGRKAQEGRLSIEETRR
jgi:hypothetical protein